jgi:hypothetical protein
MILVRTVFQVREGHIRDLVEMMKQATQAELCVLAHQSCLLSNLSSADRVFSLLLRALPAALLPAVNQPCRTPR